MSEPAPKLPAGVDALLREFPLLEPDFEAQAEAISARLEAGSVSQHPDDVLGAPPLAAEPGEPAPSLRSAAAPKPQFAEMARRSLQRSDTDASGLAKELLAASAQSRRPDADMVERVRAASRAPAPPRATPLPGSEQRPDDAPRASGVVVREQSAGNRGRRAAWLGVASGSLALAACIALLVKSGPDAAPTTAALVAAEKAASPTPSPTDGRAARSTQGVEGLDGVQSPEALGVPPAADKGVAVARKSGSGAGNLAVGASEAAAPASAATKPEAIVLEDDTESAKQAAEPKAKPPAATEEPPLRPAQGDNAGVTVTPSAGAVSAALGSVRGVAQACLAGQNGSVNAVVTFASDGSVTRVSASGPAGPCIQAALSKARLPPFARESFNANTTIRPP